ncbi:MoaD/ThiS family protein [Candidatus Poribacteria bacterium]|nr:MoaD/ThiS family protein [Candidatus Poribacteria bacterium]
MLDARSKKNQVGGTEKMKIRLELIGYLAKSGLPNGYKAGELDVADGTTMGQLLALLQISKEMQMLIAVNGRVPDESCILHAGDIVQFAPPIAGG